MGSARTLASVTGGRCAARKDVLARFVPGLADLMERLRLVIDRTSWRLNKECQTFQISNSSQSRSRTLFSAPLLGATVA